MLCACSCVATAHVARIEKRWGSKQSRPVCLLLGLIVAFLYSFHLLCLQMINVCMSDKDREWRNEAANMPQSLNPNRKNTCMCRITWFWDLFLWYNVWNPFVHVWIHVESMWADTLLCKLLTWERWERSPLRVCFGGPHLYFHISSPLVWLCVDYS